MVSMKRIWIQLLGGCAMGFLTVVVPCGRASDLSTASTVFVTTHASSIFNTNQSTKPTVDRMALSAWKNGIPVAHLVHGEPQTYFPVTFANDSKLMSVGGEINIALQASHIVAAGGFFDACFEGSSEYYFNHALRRKAIGMPTTLTVLADAVYTTDVRTLAFELNRAVTTYGKLKILSRNRFLVEAYESDLWLDGSPLSVGGGPSSLFKVHIVTNSYLSQVGDKVWMGLN